MSHFKEKHKEYLVKNGIKTEDDLVIYLDILRNSRNSPKEDRRMLMDFAWLLINEKSSVSSFLAENKNIEELDKSFEGLFKTNPSKDFYNAFKQTTSSPTFMDEVVNDLQDKEEKIVVRFHCDSNNSIIVQTVYKKDLEETAKSLKATAYFMLGYETKTEVPSFKTIEDSAWKGSPATMEDMFLKVGKKETEGKLFYELDFEFIKQMAERMQSNKDNSKYELWNWKKPLSEKDLEELKQAMWRHIIAVMSGELEDDGRPFGHLEAISNNAMMINYQLKLNKC